MNKLFCDLKTDEEKAAFFLSGRGYETGVISQAIQNDVAMAYHRCVEYKKELEALQAQDQEDAERYRFIRSIVSASNARGRGSWQFHYDRLPMPLNNPMKGSVAQHFDEAIDHALRIEDKP